MEPLKLYLPENVILREDLSNADYFLYAVLDENGFIPNERNFNILVEAINNGHVVLIEANARVKKYNYLVNIKGYSKEDAKKESGADQDEIDTHEAGKIVGHAKTASDKLLKKRNITMNDFKLSSDLLTKAEDLKDTAQEHKKELLKKKGVGSTKADTGDHDHNPLSSIRQTARMKANEEHYGTSLPQELETRMAKGKVHDKKVQKEYNKSINA